ncbi:cytochrome c [Dissulfurispira thermophila]|uniref:Cytochrome c n=1 Tax=Dissulfurispira thermophila TaxID=2715679 RepID=A0A7G1H182_9BACT|nr:virulence protein RhuM/Fic/DOC family protein [Dissulfurispira thermophila]BCB95447.1 cytochrome c [Dissulfurispira thermophila]
MNKNTTKKHYKNEIKEPLATYGVKGGEILFYKAPDGNVNLEVRLEKDTIWLTQKQMAMLFETERSVITKHLKNIFNSNELEKDSVCAFFAHTAEDGKTYKTQYYNLDAIISVGYRVNSKRGTQFRIWATQVLRDHILKGYTINAKRLEELQSAIKIISRVIDKQSLSNDEATALLRVVSEYSFALNLLDDYDHGRLPDMRGETTFATPVTIDEVTRMVEVLRKYFGGSSLFGMLKDNRLEGTLNAVFQTIDGKDLYPSIEEKAANLLYFLVKNHHFVDGNKRIGASVFLWFLEKNGRLKYSTGENRISQEALVALTLLIAESDPKEKDVMIRLTTVLLQEKIKSQGDNYARK